MLITKTIMMKWNGRTKQYYESKGYLFTKIGDEFEIKVEDLTNGSSIKVEVQCDDCNKKYFTIWGDYKKSVNADNEIYCLKCVRKLYGGENSRKARLKNGISFYEWCISNNKQDILDRWDYELNKCSPSEISFSSIGFNKQGYYFKCPRGIHNSELQNITRLTSGQNYTIKCHQCNSFAQWGIDNVCSDFLEKYWDYEKNIVNPFEIEHGNRQKVFIKCQEKNYHESYRIKCVHFTNGSRCPCCKCNGGKIHILDSLGTLYPQVLKIWSDKNEKSPYDYSPNSGEKVWWKCPNGKYEDYLRNIDCSNFSDFRCPDCQFSKGEKRIEDWLMNNSYIEINRYDYNELNNHTKQLFKYFIPQLTFTDLLGLKNGLLSYDFYLPTYNLLIEYQGEYHDGTVSNQTEEDYSKQIEHDRRKKEYADSHNIELLEIWYWDFENIEEILNNKLKGEINE